jgi:hypothetical protein
MSDVQLRNTYDGCLQIVLMKMVRLKTAAFISTNGQSMVTLMMSRKTQMMKLSIVCKFPRCNCVELVLYGDSWNTDDDLFRTDFIESHL